MRRAQIFFVVSYYYHTVHYTRMAVATSEKEVNHLFTMYCVLPTPRTPYFVLRVHFVGNGYWLL